jgi:hypothetical protein
LSLGARCSCDGDAACNAAIAEIFAWGEFFGAEQKKYLKGRMRASVKEVQKLSAKAKKAVGSVGGPSYGAAGKRSRSARRGARNGSAAGGDRSFPPRLR